MVDVLVSECQGGETTRSPLNAFSDRWNFMMADVHHSFFFTPFQYQQITRPMNRYQGKQIL
jgi:hypothetical protein